MSKDKPCILKKRLNGALDQNIGLIIQRFPNTLLISPGEKRGILGGNANTQKR